MRRLAAAILIGLAFANAAPAQDDSADRAIERYLERLGQRALLIEHLDQRLSRTTGAQRASLAERLTSLVAEELEAANSPRDRAALERRARALLDVIPEADSIDLRLSLHRATYANAEEIAERWRLRLASAEEVEEARRVFPSLATDLARLGSAANQRVETLERLEESARTGLDEDEIAAQLADSRRRRSMAMYLSAWCLVYQAELDDARPPALEAIPRFGWLLNAPAGQSPDIERVPEHTLAFEHVARAALGVATAIGIAGDPGLAERWIDLVEEAEEVDPGVLAQARKRRMILLARAARWTELNLLVKELRGVEGQQVDRPAQRLDAATARLLAVLAFEQPAGREAPAQLALRQAAFGDLIARNEVAQVVDLASRYGTEALGADGFVPDYVRGLQAYRAATSRQRAAGEPDTPTTDPSIREQLLVSVRLFDAALASADAEANPAARADALMLAASAAYLASGSDPRAMRSAADRAADAFDEALDDSRRADALWLRVRALRAARATRTDSASLDDLTAQADEAASLFTQLFPTDPRAGALVLERASASTSPATDPETLEALLAIEPGSPSYDAARRRAAAVLFESAANAPQPTARRDAIRFVEVAGPILDEDSRAALSGDAARSAQAALLARQILAVLLADQVAEAGLALRAADRLESLVRAGAVDDPQTIAELRYRQLQIAILRDDPSRIDEARAALQSLETPQARRYRDAADRLMYRRAVNLWRQSPGDATHARAVVESGVRVLSALTAGQGGDDPATVSAMVIVSDAAATLWTRRADAEALQLARRLMRRALVAQPNSIGLLRRAATLATAAGDHEEAAARWSVIRAGAELGTQPWFEASTNRLEALAHADPATARDELAKHLSLYPEGGPPPWGERVNQVRSALTETAP